MEYLMWFATEMVKITREIWLPAATHNDPADILVVGKPMHPFI